MTEKRTYYPPCFAYPCLLIPYRLGEVPAPCLLRNSVHPPMTLEAELESLAEIKTLLSKQIEIISNRIEEIERAKNKKPQKPKK